VLAVYRRSPAVLPADAAADARCNRPLCGHTPPATTGGGGVRLPGRPAFGRLPVRRQKGVLRRRNPLTQRLRFLSSDLSVSRSRVVRCVLRLTPSGRRRRAATSISRPTAALRQLATSTTSWPPIFAFVGDGAAPRPHSTESLAPLKGTSLRRQQARHTTRRSRRRATGRRGRRQRRNSGVDAASNASRGALRS